MKAVHEKIYMRKIGQKTKDSSEEDELPEKEFAIKLQ